MFVHSPKWRSRQYAEIEVRAAVDHEGKTIVGAVGQIGDYLEGIDEGDLVLLGEVFRDGRRKRMTGRVMSVAPSHSEAGLRFAISLECDPPEILAPHPDEIKRQKEIERINDMHRMSSQIADDMGQTPSGYVSEKVREDFEDALMELADDVLSTGEEGVEKILEMITTRVGMAREGL